ncbi:TorF family putative porin [Opitutus sp. GAS368]|uniref:TorF family putative porin n=1 Tax=Opitutus sp. GAS368 TaxID=1882749 RepID=UPI0012FDE813|nr:TorF family putative porin [Opitutus sp. GAS368]
MKKTALLLAALVAGASLPAQTAAPAPATPAPAPAAPAAPAADAAPSSSWVFTPAFANQYMFRGTRLGGPAFEPSLEYDAGNLAVGVWNNTPLKDKVVGQSDPEFDFYGSYTIEVIKDTLSWQPGYTIYTYPNAKQADGFYKATYEPNLALNYTVAGVKFTPKIYYDLRLKGPTYELTVAYTVPLTEAKSELDFIATAGTFKWTSAAPDQVNSLGQPADVKNYGNYWLVGVSAPYQVTKDSKLSLSLAYTKGSDNFFKTGTDGKVANTAAVGRGVISISYAITF